MGWLNKKERRKVLKKFGVVAYYLCNGCKKPITDQAPVQDPRKGFHIIDVGSAMSSHFIKEPKVTYHSGYCNDKSLGKKVRRVPQLSERQQHVANEILAMLRTKRKKKGYWTIDRLRLTTKFSRKRIVRAIKYLKMLRRIKKKKGAYVAI